jgi:glycosyltransferase involved in cell wall biosynthesis
MQKKVSIIVPFHGETEAQLGICLASINNQIGIDFKQVEVVLIGDGGLKVDDKDPFPYLRNLDIKIYEYDVVKGPGFARSMGMFMATGQYFMFIDADDQLHYVGALLDFFNATKEQDHQLVIGRYINQTRNDQREFRYYTHGNNDWKAAYAKWFNRAYLESINLSWSENLQVFEDTYFVGAACELATDIALIEPIVYTHLWNEHSITHDNDGQNFYRQLDQWVLAQRLFLEKIAKYKPDNLAADYLDYMADIYLRYQAYPPLDAQAFRTEHSNLIFKFADQWPRIKEQLPAAVEAKIRQMVRYHGYTAKGLSEFIRSQDAVLQEHLAQVH